MLPIEIENYVENLDRAIVLCLVQQAISILRHNGMENEDKSVRFGFVHDDDVIVTQYASDECWMYEVTGEVSDDNIILEAARIVEES